MIRLTFGLILALIASIAIWATYEIDMPSPPHPMLWVSAIILIEVLLVASGIRSSKKHGISIGAFASRIIKGIIAGVAVIVFVFCAIGALGGLVSLGFFDFLMRGGHDWRRAPMTMGMYRRLTHMQTSTGLTLWPPLPPLEKVPNPNLLPDDTELYFVSDAFGVGGGPTYSTSRQAQTTAIKDSMCAAAGGSMGIFLLILLLGTAVRRNWLSGLFDENVKAQETPGA
jgi:hypothetical protein